MLLINQTTLHVFEEVLPSLIFGWVKWNVYYPVYSKTEFYTSIAKEDVGILKSIFLPDIDDYE